MMKEKIDSKLAEVLMEVSAIMGRVHDTEHNGPFEPNLFVWSNPDEFDSWVEVAHDEDVGIVIKVGVGVKDYHRVLAVYGYAALLKERASRTSEGGITARMELI